MGEDDFGRYRIVRELGEGGMGTVYLAEQLEPIRRPVALKVVKLGMDTAQVLARFHNERQALAVMDHPNIARIFDAGATKRGRPYFVMEYIEGAPITRYCDRKRLTTKERLQLFLAVCRAVQHAHEKRIIHRDLKPSNILVSEHDGTPIPKIIDFGIAKAIDKWAVENTMLTDFGQIVGTPEYASPEQAETMQGVVDELSDVYSLGVLLYELIIGAVPFDSATLRNAGLAEMLRIIREDEAPPLPRKLTSMGAGANDVAARRRTDPDSLRRLVDGDLNAITLKALEKVRERRYPSVSDLAADVQRHLEERPVLASPPSHLYRARKFLRRHRLNALSTAAVTTILLLGGVTVWSLTRNSTFRPKLSAKDTIVLADFNNRTGDPVFDDTLREALAVELQQAPFTLVPGRTVQQTLVLMGRPKAPLTSELAQQVCERTSSTAILEGSIARVGNQYLMQLRAANCATGNILDQQQAIAPTRDDVLTTLTQLARTFRTNVGESLALVERNSTPLAEATTPSLEALKAYSTGVRNVLNSGNETGIPFFLRAVELDPQFALAFAQLGLSYSTVGESELSAANTTKAFQLRDRVSLRERFFIDFSYDRQVTGNLEKAYQTLELWLKTDPRPGGNADPYSLRGGISGIGTGRYQTSIALYQEIIKTDPTSGMTHGSLAAAFFRTNRFSEAESTIQLAARRQLVVPTLLIVRYNLAALKGDQLEMDRIVSLAKGKRRAEHWIAHQESLALARTGRLLAARRSADRAVDLALQEQFGRESAASYRASRAVWEALFGNTAEGRKSALAALELSKGRDVQYAVAWALALSGDTLRSESLNGDLEKRFPEDTFVKFTYAPVLSAFAALRRARPAESVERLEIARQYELAANGLSFNGWYLGGLHSAFVRGQALMAAQQYPAAIAEFQKILDQRGVVALDPVGPLAYLQLGRGFAASGDKVKAKAAYQSFLTLWKDADPDVPILKAAQAEFARL